MKVGVRWKVAEGQQLETLNAVFTALALKVLKIGSKLSIDDFLMSCDDRSLNHACGTYLTLDD